MDGKMDRIRAALVNSTIYTENKPRLRDRTEPSLMAWQCSGSILSTFNPGVH